VTGFNLILTGCSVPAFEGFLKFFGVDQVVSAIAASFIPAFDEVATESSRKPLLPRRIDLRIHIRLLTRFFLTRKSTMRQAFFARGDSYSLETT
jgi:hypothetical protein